VGCLSAAGALGFGRGGRAIGNVGMEQLESARKAAEKACSSGAEAARGVAQQVSTQFWNIPIVRAKKEKFDAWRDKQIQELRPGGKYSLENYPQPREDIWMDPNRPRIKPTVLCGWWAKDSNLQSKIQRLDDKILEKKYECWRIQKHKPMSEEEMRRNWGIFAPKGDPIENRRKHLEKLEKQMENLQARKASYEQELHDFKDYLKKEWRWRSSVASEATYRPKWRYPSETKMWDDQEAMANRPTEKTMSERLEDVGIQIGFKFIETRNLLSSTAKAVWRAPGNVVKGTRNFLFDWSD